MIYTKENNLHFVPVTKDNIILATEIEMKFWSNSCAYNSYLNAYNKGKPYWLVYKDDEIVGISGIYDYPELGEKNTAWLGWFGVLEKFRGLGYGKEILLKTLDIAKEQGYSILRLYSSKRTDLCPNAVPFYNKISSQFNGFVEDYTLEQLEMQRIVVSFSLNGQQISKWNNRNLFLEKDKKDENDGLLKFIQEKELIKNNYKKRITNKM